MNARSPNCAGVRAWLCLFFNHINIACTIRNVKHIFYIYFDKNDLCAWHVTVQTGCSSKSAAAAKYICVWHVTVQTGCSSKSVAAAKYICVWHVTVQTGCSSKSVAAAKYICVWHVTVQTGCSCCSLSAQSIHLREKNIAGPTERSSKGGVPPLLIARREGPAFFDEDDLCAAI